VLAGGLAEARFRRGRTIVTETTEESIFYVLTFLLPAVRFPVE
jgi:hypothetical protein